MLTRIQLKVNGQEHSVTVDPETPLLFVLNDELGLRGPKFGCGMAQCGSCTVIADGKAVMSCVTPIMLFEGRNITTLEGLGAPANPAPIQQAFVEVQAAQCGYCIAGMIMRAQALLEKNPDPTDADIRATLQPNLCRCGTHMRILKAVRRAAELIRQKGAT